MQKVETYTSRKKWYYLLVSDTSHLKILKPKRILGMELINQLGYIRETVMGISQEQLARKAHISRRTISDIELNRRIPSVKTALIIAKALRCSVEDIFILR